MGSRDIAEFGIGLAAAVELDAFILRTVLVPGAMHLFGDANWWLPAGWTAVSRIWPSSLRRPRQPHPFQPPRSVNPGPARPSSRGSGAVARLRLVAVFIPNGPGSALADLCALGHRDGMP
jgi:hypothetical protein